MFRTFQKALGFGESSGMPTPKQTTASIDVVIQYAIYELGFTEDQIVIYAWSIGGFPATWAAANYPNIKVVFIFRLNSTDFCLENYNFERIVIYLVPDMTCQWIIVITQLFLFHVQKFSVLL